MFLRKIALLYVFIILFSCKEVKKETEDTAKNVLSLPEKIAKAHGYSNWNLVKNIAFTFNVDRDSTHFERTWVWNTKNNDIASISGTDTLRYNRKEMDSIAHKTNSGFINDRYWLLAPFNLIWDENSYEHELTKDVISPLGKKPMDVLTIVYDNKGGYTPGDAYDLYFDDDYIIREWVFRKANQAEPSMTTTWENYTAINGLKLALDHKTAEGNFNLYFTGIKVE